jgi:amidase
MNDQYADQIAEGTTMALQVPTTDELKKIARANHVELTVAELAALESMMPAQIATLQIIDSISAEPQPSVTRYRDRKAGGRPAAKDDPLNAIVTRCSVKGAPSGPLRGKRVGVKDSVCVAGIPASGGSSVLKGWVSDFDATIVARMLDAGAEIVATLNMDDFALSGDGRTSTYGPARNPHNPDYCTGGSSCGSAAALYYDDIDLTIGTDQGGSIRIPASWSGVVGIKPTYGLVPYTGVMSIDPTLDHAGPMARSVSDVALLLEVLAGKDALDHRQREVKLAPYREALGKPIDGMKIGVVREGFTQAGAQPDVNAAVNRAVAALGKLGARASEISIPEHQDAAGLIYAIVPEGMAMLARTNLQGTHHQGAYIPSLAAHFAKRLPERANDLALTVKFMLIFGDYLHQRYHGRLYAAAQRVRPALTAKYDAALETYDALAMPSTPVKAHRIDEQAPYSMLGNTAPFDITGHPAISVPCAKSEGLPVGMMLIGRHFDEPTLFTLAHAYEQSVDWTKA